jgi:transcriptional regulator with XRE-family HTH domain
VGRIFKQAARREGKLHGLAVHVGRRILELRQRDGVTMRDVSNGTKLSNAFICQLENGQSQPSAETLWALAQYFKVPVGFFFEGYDGCQ